MFIRCDFVIMGYGSNNQLFPCIFIFHCFSCSKNLSKSEAVCNISQHTDIINSEKLLAPGWRTTPCWWCVITYSIYWQLSSIPVNCFFQLQPVYIPYHGDRHHLKMANTGRRETHTEFWWGNLKGMRLLGRPRCRWEDNIEMDLKEIGWGGIDWINVACELVSWCEHSNEPLVFIKCGTFLD